MGEVSWGQARKWITGGYVLVDGQITMDPACVVRAGAELCIDPKPSTKKKTSRALTASAPSSDGSSASSLATSTRPQDEWILHLDSQVVVVNKPTGISTEPYDRAEKNTLDQKIARAISRGGRRGRVYVVHRLDKETTGVLVFARTHDAQERLKNQFRFHTTERRYLALVHGHPPSRSIRTQLVRDRGDGLRGSTQNSTLGREAITHVEVMERFENTSLVSCRLETGRTHQIRIHLAEAGHPLLGERVYSKGFSGHLVSAPRVMLHAELLAFDHPSDARRLRFSQGSPDDFAKMLARLRAKP